MRGDLPGSTTLDGVGYCQQTLHALLATLHRASLRDHYFDCQNHLAVLDAEALILPGPAYDAPAKNQLQPQVSACRPCGYAPIAPPRCAFSGLQSASCPVDINVHGHQIPACRPSCYAMMVWHSPHCAFFCLLSASCPCDTSVHVYFFAHGSLPAPTLRVDSGQHVARFDGCQAPQHLGLICSCPR